MFFFGFFVSNDTYYVENNNLDEPSGSPQVSPPEPAKKKVKHVKGALSLILFFPQYQPHSTEPKPIPPINYTVAIYLAEEMSKIPSKRKAHKLRAFDLKQTDEWDALKLELLQIGEKYFGLPLNLDRFVVTYSIPRTKASDPIALIDGDDYTTILKMVQPMKAPAVNITFCEKVCHCLHCECTTNFDTHFIAQI